MMFTELPLAWLPLADAVAKATVVLALAAAVSFLLRHRSAALRHLVWTLALGSALLLPVLSFALPKWQLALFTVPDSLSQPLAAPAADSEIAPARVPGLRRQLAAQPTVAGQTGAAEPATIGSGAGPARITWQAALIGLWIAGALCILGRIAIGLAAVRWVSRRAHEITDAPWLGMARDIALDMGVSPRVRFLRGGPATMPIATGIFRPSVLMPAEADSWPASRLRVVVLHELAHVRRRDCLTHLLAQAAWAFYWFNPLAWLAVKRARAERERACDDLVLACGTRGSEYADQLLEMARTLRGDRFPALLGGAALAMAHRSQLEGRLIAILDPRVPRAGVTRGRVLAAIALCAVAVAPLGALQPWTSSQEVTAPGDRRAAAAMASDALRPVTPVPHNASATPPAIEVSRTLAEPTTPAAQFAFLNPAPGPAPMSDDAFAPLSVAAAAAVAQSVEAAFEGGVAEAVFEADVQDAKVPAQAKPGQRVDPRTIAALTAALKDTDKEVRETALQALVQLRDPSIFEPLVQALKDGSPDVREQAAFGLGQLRDARAIQPLLASLKDDNPDVREQVVFALGQIRDPAAVEPLISGLKDAVGSVREQAAFALGQIRDRRAVEALIIAVRDTDIDVREQVVFALGQLRDPRAIEALTIALKDQSADVRRQAAFSLGQLAR